MVRKGGAKGGINVVLGAELPTGEQHNIHFLGNVTEERGAAPAV